MPPIATTFFAMWRSPEPVIGVHEGGSLAGKESFEVLSTISFKVFMGLLLDGMKAYP
jgi:hypothetical protein